MSDHARLSPSAAHRWGACPASVREEAKYPEPPSGPAAIDGTHTHSLLEHCIDDGCWAKGLVGTTMTDHEGKFTVDAERADRVDFALRYIRERAASVKDAVVLSERKVDPSARLGRSDLGGTVDVTIFGDDWVEIIDLKDGMNPVNAVNNPQLELYGYGVLSDQVPAKLSRIICTIIQPKLCLKGMTGISSWEISLTDFIATTRSKIVAQAAATDDPNAPFVPGEVQCRYCRAKGGCAALANHALSASGISFANLDVAKDVADKDPSAMTDQQIREVLEAAPLIRQMIEGCEAEAMRRFETGHPIDGLKAVRGRGSRSWAFDEEVIAEKLKKMGIPKGTLWKTSLISPAQAEKVTWEKRDGSKVTLSPRQLKTLQTEYIKKSDGKLTIAPLSDDRPAVTLSAAGMFAPVPAELPSFLQLPAFLT